MPRRRWHIQGHQGWVLHCQHPVHCRWCNHLLGLYQAGGYEDSSTAIEGVAHISRSLDGFVRRLRAAIHRNRILHSLTHSSHLSLRPVSTVMSLLLDKPCRVYLQTLCRIVGVRETICTQVTDLPHRLRCHTSSMPSARVRHSRTSIARFLVTRRLGSANNGATNSPTRSSCAAVSKTRRYMQGTGSVSWCSRCR
jgi:hypothetical protein